MSLRPQDILCALKIFALGVRGEGERNSWSFSELAISVGLSKGEAHNAVRRALQAGIVVATTGKVTVVERKLHNFLIHGLPTMYYAVRGPVSKGIPTAFSAPLFAGKAVAPVIPMVWKYEQGGKIQGETLEPLYPTVPQAAASDAMLYDLLVLVDGVRVGGFRERKIAEGLLDLMLLPSDKDKDKEKDKGKGKAVG